MKKLVWLLLALVLSVSVVGCDKRENTEGITTEATVIELEREKLAETASVVDAVDGDGEVDLEEKLGKSHTIQIIECNAAIRYQGNDFPFSFERGLAINGLDNAINEIIYDLDKIEAELVNIADDKTSVTFEKTYTINNSEELIYEITYQLNDTSFIPKLCELVNHKDMGKRILSYPKYHGDVIRMNDDIKKENNILLFENFVNLYYTNRKLYVEDYIKVNMTNSIYDEYLVFFTKGAEKWNGIRGADDFSVVYIEDVVHFIIDDVKVLQAYNINRIGLQSTEIARDSDGNIFYYRDLKYPGYKMLYNGTLSFTTDLEMPQGDLGELFSFGHVADFNQNGFNEVYICNYSDEYFAFEFNGLDFNYYLLSDKQYDYTGLTWRSFLIDYVDWDNGRIYLKYPYYAGYEEIVQWIPEDNCFRLIKYKIED